MSEADKLKAELREKEECFENLKKAYDDLVDEIKEANQRCEDLEGDLKSRESIIKHISFANDKLREHCEEKFREWEDEKRALVLALEEAEKKDGVSVAKKFFESEKSLKEDNRFQKLLAEESKMMEEQLKRKNKHLGQIEEVHEKQPERFDTSEDLECEAFALLDDISSLQIKLHSQARTSEDLERQLQNEESRRKEMEHNIKMLEQENQELRLKKESYEKSIIELKLQNEELSVMLLVLRRGISEGQGMEKGNDEENELDMDDYRERLEEAYDALDRANFELEEKIHEGKKMECELEIWKSAYERMENDLEESHARRKELETSLLAQVVFGESIKQQRRTEEAEKDKVKFLEIIAEKDKILEVLQKEIEWLEHEAYKRESESAVAVKSFIGRTNEEEKEKFMQLVNGRKMRMDEIMHQLNSLQHHFSDSLTSYAAQEDDGHGAEAEGLVQKLKKENKRLIKSASRLSSERESLLGFVLGLGDKICEFSSTDAELMDIMRSMVTSFGKEDDDDDDDGFIVSENMIINSATEA